MLERVHMMKVDLRFELLKRIDLAGRSGRTLEVLHFEKEEILQSSSTPTGGSSMSTPSGWLVSLLNEYWDCHSLSRPLFENSQRRRQIAEMGGLPSGATREIDQWNAKCIP